MNTNDGGPAFPNPDSSANTGMTLRDYFAAKAMQGLMINPENLQNPDSGLWADLANDAYKIANAMIVARGGK